MVAFMPIGFRKLDEHSLQRMFGEGAKICDGTRSKPEFPLAFLRTGVALQERMSLWRNVSLQMSVMADVLPMFGQVQFEEATYLDRVCKRFYYGNHKNTPFLIVHRAINWD